MGIRINAYNVTELRLINFIGSKSKDEISKYGENLTESEKKIADKIIDIIETESSSLTNYNKQMVLNGLRFKLIQSKSSDRVSFQAGSLRK